jgi:hypothetical protein
LRGGSNGAEIADDITDIWSFIAIGQEGVASLLVKYAKVILPIAKRAGVAGAIISSIVFLVDVLQMS